MSVLVSYPNRNVIIISHTADTNEKPFVCACGAAFTRRDLLTRHHRLSLHSGEAGKAGTGSEIIPTVAEKALSGPDDIDRDADTWNEQQALVDSQVEVNPGEQRLVSQVFQQQTLIAPQPMFDHCEQPMS